MSDTVAVTFKVTHEHLRRAEENRHKNDYACGSQCLIHEAAEDALKTVIADYKEIWVSSAAISEAVEEEGDSRFTILLDDVAQRAIQDFDRANYTAQRRNSCLCGDKTCLNHYAPQVPFEEFETTVHVPKELTLGFQEAKIFLESMGMTVAQKELA